MIDLFTPPAIRPGKPSLVHYLEAPRSVKMAARTETAQEPLTPHQRALRQVEMARAGIRLTKRVLCRCFAISPATAKRDLSNLRRFGIVQGRK